MATADATQTADTLDLSRAVGTEIIQLSPRDLVLPAITDVRPWESATDKDEEQARIERLAKTIEEEGQLQPVVAREVIDAETGHITYELIAGRRRRAAIDLINQKRAMTGGKGAGTDLLPINVSVLRGVSDDSAFRKAMMENAQRLQMSPMDMAMNVIAIRTRMGWDEKKDWSKRIADFLGVSRAFVTQKVKLFELDPAMQADIHSGKLSEEAAWAAIKVKPEHRETVMARAEELAAQEASKPAVDGETETVATDPESPLPDGTGATSTPAESGKVTESQVIAAARETEGALEKAIPLNRKELIQSFEQFDSPVYGEKNGAVRKFVVYLVDTYAKGTGTPTMFKRLFGKMVEGSDKGTPEPEKEAKVTKAQGKAAATAKVAATPAKAAKATKATKETKAA